MIRSPDAPPIPGQIQSSKYIHLFEVPVTEDDRRKWEELLERTKEEEERVLRELEKS